MSGSTSPLPEWEVLRRSEDGRVAERWPIPAEVADLLREPEAVSAMAQRLERAITVIENYDGELGHVRGMEYTQWASAWSEIKDAIIGPVQGHSPNSRT